MLVSGKNVVNEIFKKNVKINKAYVLDSFDDQNIISTLEKKQINIRWLDKKQIMEFAIKNHQGIILDIADYNYSEIDEFTKNDDSIIVILDHLEDPHNLGAIVRTCEALGVDGIIIPKNRSVEVNDTVIKVSAGAIFNVKVAMVTNLVSVINDLKKKGYWIFGTDMDGDDLTECDYRGKVCLIIGNEGKGISRLVKENCDFVVKIPMRGEINSLNASVAAGIIIFEAVKNRR